MTRHILIATALGCLIASTALARVIHPPAPTAEEPGDAPADGIVDARQIDVDASSGDVSVRYNRNATIVTHGRTVRERAPEVINSSDSHQAVPVPEVTEQEQTDEEDANAPQIHTTDDGVRFVSGGIGTHDARHIRALQKDFRLKLQFAASSGHFLSEVRVQIRNATGGTVVELTTEGPVLLVDLPAGSYALHAEYDESEVEKPLTVPAKGLKGYAIVFSDPII